MSSYTAIIHCDRCGRILANIHAEHEDRPDWFVPQDIMEREFKISSMFCQDCLNGRDEKEANNENNMH